MSGSIVAYCVKCRDKRDMLDPRPVFTRSGQPATQGVCPRCGTKLFRIGRTPAHAGLEPGQHLAESGREHPKLVIVESPAKARTLGRFLGPGYTVKASVGHVRDLPANRLGVDVERDFEPRYVIPQRKKDVLRELKAEARQASEIYLATDPDREGEAIAWHLVEALGRIASLLPVRRVEFHEITPEAVQDAFAHPRSIDVQRVDAQQARRILDRLVGYMISPLLRERMGRKGISAGRVQSVAVRLIVEREREIAAFVPVEYWSIAAELAKRQGQPAAAFLARLWRVQAQDVDLKGEPAVRAVVDELEGARYVVRGVEQRERRRRPAAPFTTSSLQQEASRRLGFTARQTMAVAQSLYEGIDIGGEERVGLITYMRTDSTHVASSAQQEARQVIEHTFGADYLPPQPPLYKTRTKAAQEAHEAIRPTSARRAPAALKPYLERAQYRLYELIWKRFIASQMAPAVMDVVRVEIEASRQPGAPGAWSAELRATGSTLKFPGCLAVYEEGREDGAEITPDRGGLVPQAKDTHDEGQDEAGQAVALPPLEVGEELDLLRLLPEQHFSQPPPRYSEASLVRALEEYGIGRPSTYAPILSTIQQRYYVERIERRFVPTELGYLVNDLLVEHFPDIVDVDFTARMEEELDRVASGQLAWLPMLHAFYGPFSRALDEARQTMPAVRLPEVPAGQACPTCGSPLLIKLGRYGRFIGCSGYPACRYRASISVKTGARCPECGGDIVEKKTRKKRTFYSCVNFGAGDEGGCTFRTWKRPLPQPCPACGSLLVEAGRGQACCVACQASVAISDLDGSQA